MTSLFTAHPLQNAGEIIFSMVNAITVEMTSELIMGKAPRINNKIMGIFYLMVKPNGEIFNWFLD